MTSYQHSFLIVLKRISLLQKTHQVLNSRYSHTVCSVSLLKLGKVCTDNSSICLCSLRTCLSADLTMKRDIVRYKSNKRRKNTQTHMEDDSGSEEEVEELDEEDFDNDDEVAGPPGYKNLKVHSLRCDTIIARGLNYSNSETQKLFYSSKLLSDNDVLLKKSKKVEEGETLDVVIEDLGSTRKVKRVEIVKISSVLTKKGNPTAYTRVWRAPFEVDNF